MNFKEWYKESDEAGTIRYGVEIENKIVLDDVIIAYEAGQRNAPIPADVLKLIKEMSDANAYCHPSEAAWGADLQKRIDTLLEKEGVK